MKGSTVCSRAKSFSWLSSCIVGLCGADELRLRPAIPGSAKSRLSVSEACESGLSVVFVFEASRRILMLEGIRMLSREPPPCSKGLPEAFARGAFQLVWGFE
jgi:hypothetical protein